MSLKTISSPSPHHHQHHLINSTSDDDDEDEEFSKMLDNKLMNDYSDNDEDDEQDQNNQQNPLLSDNNNTPHIVNNIDTTQQQQLQQINNSSIIVGGGSFVRNKENSTITSTSTINGISNNESKYELIIEQLRIILLNNPYLYWIYYITMITLCIILLVWSIIQQGRPHVSDKSIYELFLSIEGIITIILILEILVRIFVIYNGRILSYLFDDFINWFDLIVSIFCIIGFILYLVTVNRFEERIEELIDSLLITFRFLTQTIRIISLIRNHRKAKQQVQDQQFIDLSNSEPIPLMEIGISSSTNLSNHGIINNLHDDDDIDTDDEHHHHHEHNVPKENII